MTRTKRFRPSGITYVSAITTDRTGGRTLTGVEFEDLVSGEDIFESEWAKLESTSIEAESWRSRFSTNPSLEPQRLADMLAGAMILVMREMVPRSDSIRHEMYRALTESLRNKLWQGQVFPLYEPTAEIPLKGEGGEQQRIQELEEGSFHYRHESPAITQAFLSVAKSFRPEADYEKPQYVDIE